MPKARLLSQSALHALDSEPQNGSSRHGESLKIGDVARRLGISASMVRAWERVGLASPARTDSKYRVYTSEDVKVLRRAVYLRRVQGLNAAAILRQLEQEGLLLRQAPALSEEASTLGPQLRKLRIKRGESLSTVADAVGVSIGYLSNLERSQSGGSIGTMRKLAQYYGVNILDFFSPSETTGPLVRPRDRKVLPGGPGVRMELLASGKITMEPHLFGIEPGAGSGESYSHEGEEFLFVVRGRLLITLENEEFQLRAGDSFYFMSRTPHSWCNPSQSQTVIIWVNTPPTF